MDSIGIDLHKRESQLCTITEDGELLEQRIVTSRERFSAVLGARAHAGILLEASTESEWVARHLDALGHTVIVADPGFAAMYATRSTRVKTGKRDARSSCRRARAASRSSRPPCGARASACRAARPSRPLPSWPRSRCRRRYTPRSRRWLPCGARCNVWWMRLGILSCVKGLDAAFR